MGSLILIIKNPIADEVDIKGTDEWMSEPIFEYQVDFDKGQLALHNISPNDFYSGLLYTSFKEPVNQFYFDNQMQTVYLKSDANDQFNVWDFKNESLLVHQRLIKMSNFGVIEKKATANDIYKFNQQYRLVVAFNFIGPHQLEQAVTEKNVDEIKKILPLGYKPSIKRWSGWDKKDKNQYYLIFLIILIIYFICAMVFESFFQPFAIIALIPVSFIGTFITFYIFSMKNICNT